MHIVGVVTLISCSKHIFHHSHSKLEHIFHHCHSKVEHIFHHRYSKLDKISILLGLQWTPTHPLQHLHLRQIRSALILISMTVLRQLGKSRKDIGHMMRKLDWWTILTAMVSIWFLQFHIWWSFPKFSFYRQVLGWTLVKTVHGNDKKSDLFSGQITEEFNKNTLPDRRRDTNQLKLHWSC